MTTPEEKLMISLRQHHTLGIVNDQEYEFLKTAIAADDMEVEFFTTEMPDQQVKVFWNVSIGRVFEIPEEPAGK